MIKRLVLAVLVGVCLQLAAVPASAQVSGFAGTWNNVDPKTQFIRTVTISVDGKTVSVTGPGMRNPVTALVYGASVNADPFSTAKTLLVHRNPDSILIFHLTKAGHLEVETLNRFTDGRQPISYVSTLARQTSPVRPTDKRE